MKRILRFKNTDKGYACIEGSEKVFEISKSDLQFDVKAFYQAFYAEGKDYENIEIENCAGDDKNGRHIYECIMQLMLKIKDKLAEMPEDNNTDEQNASLEE